MTSVQQERDALSQAQERERQQIDLSMVSLTNRAKDTLSQAVTEWRNALLESIDSTTRKCPALVPRLDKLRDQVSLAATHYYEQIAELSPSPSPIEALVDQLLSLLHYAATEFAGFKVQYRNAINVDNARQSQQRLAELAAELAALKTADVIPRSQHEAILKEFRLQKDESLGLLVRQTEALETELHSDTDAYVQKLLGQLETAHREINTLRGTIGELAKPHTFTPATRDDLRMGNVVIAYFFELGVILDRAYSEYRGWEAVVYFHSDRNRRVILPSDLNVHSDRLHPLVKSLNVPKFDYDAAQGLLRLRVQLSQKPKADVAEIQKLWKPASQFAAIVSRWERVRITGGSESGKSPTAENVAVCILKQRPGAVTLANPMHNSQKNHWSIPTTWTSHEASKGAMNDLANLIDDRAEGRASREPFQLYIFDETDSTLANFSSAGGDVKRIIKQASHQNLGAIFVGQNANVSNYKGLDRSDWNNAVNCHLGSNSYDAISNSNQFTAAEQTDLKHKADRLSEFCETKNRDLGLDPKDPEAYRFALVIEPNKRPYFLELPSFGRYTYDQIATEGIRKQSVESSDGMGWNSVQEWSLASDSIAESERVSTIPQPSIPDRKGEDRSTVESERVSTIPGNSVELPLVGVCPDCGTASRERKGKPLDGKQRYFCRNRACRKQTFTVKV